MKVKFVVADQYDWFMISDFWNTDDTLTVSPNGPFTELRGAAYPSHFRGRKTSIHVSYSIHKVVTQVAAPKFKLVG